jgi:Polysaccharide deacetylase
MAAVNSTNILKSILKVSLGQKINWKISSTFHKLTGKILILNLHRVSDSKGSFWDPCPIDVFRQFIDEARKHFNICSFYELQTFNTKPKLILSFDDGYLDFYENVVPILDSYSLVCNQNLIPNCLMKQRPPLNVLIQDFAGLAPESVLRKVDWGFKFENENNLRLELLQFSRAVKRQKKQEQNLLFASIYPQIESYLEFTSAKMMTLEQVRNLPKLVTLGNHSFEHINANAMSLNEWKKDLQASQDWLEINCRVSSKIYAFPNGDYSQTHIEVLQELGFNHILLVGNQSSRSFSSIKQRVNFTPHSVRESRFDSIRPILRLP